MDEAIAGNKLRNEQQCFSLTQQTCFSHLSQMFLSYTQDTIICNWEKKQKVAVPLRSEMVLKSLTILQYAAECLIAKRRQTDRELEILLTLMFAGFGLSEEPLP